MLSKEQVLQALRVWINQRPGLEFGNYGEMSSYRAELRQITKDRRDALELLSAVALRSITAEDIINASKGAYSGRLTITEDKGRVKINYCTGQYWPTEYRKAAAAVLASVLWDYVRTGCMPKPDPKPEACPCSRDTSLHHNETYGGLNAGDWIRRHFRREFGRSIQKRWFY